jgi:hypothetical protein
MSNELVYKGNGQIPGAIQQMMAQAGNNGQNVQMRIREQSVLTKEGDVVETKEVYVWVNPRGPGVPDTPLGVLEHLANLRDRLKSKLSR